MLNKYYKLSEWEISHSGSKQACQYLKDLYVQAIHIATRQTISPIPFRKSDSVGIDRNLRLFVPYLHSDDPNDVRLALTILRLCYLIKTLPKVDVKSITSPPGGQDTFQWREFADFAHHWVKPENPRGVLLVKPRARSGPNGPSSLLTANLDAVALSDHDSLLSSLDHLARIIDPTIGSLKDWVISLSNHERAHNPNLTKRSLIHSRLAALAEGGCKTRIIAIGDLFSQYVLLPLHEKIMKRLAAIHQDGTHDQSRSVSLVKEQTLKGPLYSFDLTTATDRFPVKITEIVMTALFGKVVSQLWLKVMTDRDFSLPNAKGQTVRYAAGQPMGLYSSWPAFAFSHHVFVKFCAFQLGIASFKEYTIIGDDIVIWNPAVAKRYRATLRDLEVPISESKSMVSETKPFYGEICKRFLFNGMDLSPIPPDIIKVAIREPSYLTALLDEVWNRYGRSSSSTRLNCSQLVEIYSRRSDRKKAKILLTAPPVIAPGRFLSEVNNGSEGLKDLSLWGSFDQDKCLEVRNRLREKTLREKYQQMSIDWSIISIYGDRLGPNQPLGETDYPDSPFERARIWVTHKVEAFLNATALMWDEDKEFFLEDAGVHYVIDPYLRSYQDRRLVKSRNASRLTLATFKVMAGELEPPVAILGPPAGSLTTI